MEKKIDATLKTIQGIFGAQESILGKTGIFIIPDYQRSYNWEPSDHCDRFWQDMEDFIENKKNESYFFGSIIINNDADKLYVIDGQQRLTTFMLMLKALLIKIDDLLTNKISADKDAHPIKESLENRRREIITCLYRIDKDEVSFVIANKKQLSVGDIKYQNESINEEYTKEMEVILLGNSFDEIEGKVARIKYKQKDNRYTNFFRNFKFFVKKLENLDSTKINAFARAFLEKCQLIIVISYQTEEAIEIFNSLNSTGMPLADADIIAAKLYASCDKDKDKDKFKNDWQEIIKNANNLGSQGISTIDDILNQYMYILRAKNSEKDSTLTSVRRYFTVLKKDSLKNSGDFVSAIEKIIDIWKDKESNEKIILLKQVLFKHNNNFKFFYATYFYFNTNEKATEKLKFVEALLKLFALLSITASGYSSAKFKSFLIRLNMDIGAGSFANIIAEKIKQHITESFNSNDIYEEIVASNAQRPLVYLNEYLFAKEHDVTVEFDMSNIEIEHIMPSSGKNIQTIRDNAQMSEGDFDQYVNKLGNTILLEKKINTYISNNWFTEKKRGYNDSVFPISKSLSSHKKESWGKEDIDNATEEAADRIVKYIFS